MGIGVPGVVDRCGKIKYAANIPELENMNLGELMQKRLKILVNTINDAQCSCPCRSCTGSREGIQKCLLYNGFYRYWRRPGYRQENMDRVRRVCRRSRRSADREKRRTFRRICRNVRKRKCAD